nr:hypothetical protein [Rothia nasimurium]
MGEGFDVVDEGGVAGFAEEAWGFSGWARRRVWFMGRGVPVVMALAAAEASPEMKVPGAV